MQEEFFRSVLPALIAFAGVLIVWLLAALRPKLMALTTTNLQKKTLEFVFDVVTHAVQAAEQTTVKQLKAESFKLSQWDGRAVRDEVCAKVIKELDALAASWRSELKLVSDRQTRELILRLIESALGKGHPSLSKTISDNTPVDQKT